MTFESHVDFANWFPMREVEFKRVLDARWANSFRRHCRIGRITLKSPS